MGGSAHRSHGLASLWLALLLLGALGAGAAQGAVRAVRFRGAVIDVPRSWPVYDLSKDPHVCVRFNRHALYLGDPSPAQRCPPHAAGRTEAILISPLQAGAAAGQLALPTGAIAVGSSFLLRSAQALATVTWSRDPALVARALHLRSLADAPASVSGAAGVQARAAAAIAPSAGTVGSRPAVFTGLGFDACAAPSARAMAAWRSSPYRAIGIYIGGANAACAQPNLTPGWISTEVAAGWHLIPTYVGLQAPTNGCGCTGINPRQASAEGAAAANDAVSHARQLGIPAGNPIYDDMEDYPRGGANTTAVLAFLRAWTSQLHARGYLSGVYVNAGSGVPDLVSEFGKGFSEPDNIWIADWNGQRTTSSPYVPSGEWADHQRLHQYRGGHNETYGGVTLNIDGNYLDGETANVGGASGESNHAASLPQTPPKLSISPAPDGTTDLFASWQGATGVASWRVLAGTSPTPASLSAVGQSVAHSPQTEIVAHSAATYFAVQALGSEQQVLGTSAAVDTPAHIAIFGRSAFVPGGGGSGGVPAGCYTSHTCHLTVTVTFARTVIAHTGAESIPAGHAGIVYFTLTPRGAAMLSNAPTGRLAVQVSARDATGVRATTALNLIPFRASGTGSSGYIAQSPTIRIVGLTDFVSSQGVGGILAGCGSVPLCHITTTLAIGRTTIAHTGPEVLGENELGYLSFSLTRAGRAMLADASGNRLPAKLTIANGSSTASATVALVQFR